MSEPSADAERREAGLCGACRHARMQQSARGSVFWRCLRADADPRFPRYPPLPVRSCAGHEDSSGRHGFGRRD